MDDESLILADFGTTKQNRATLAIKVGTPEYFSPECIDLYEKNKFNSEDNALTI